MVGFRPLIEDEEEEEEVVDGMLVPESDEELEWMEEEY